MVEIVQRFVIKSIPSNQRNPEIDNYYSEGRWDDIDKAKLYITYGEAELKVIELVKKGHIYYGQIEKIYTKNKS